MGHMLLTQLGAAFRQANSEAEGQQTAVISQFAPYGPSNDDQASFVATPIYNGNTKVGVLIYQLNAKTINDIMTNSKQLG